MEKAIIACGVLYSELLGLLKGENGKIEFLRQGLHSCPDSAEMRREIQKKIDELDEKGSYQRILLGYGLCGRGVEGLKSKKSQLVIPKVHDCIPLLLGGEEVKGNIEAGGTYYLSRGWIDCGGDGYKEYLFLTGRHEPWAKRFKKFRREAAPIKGSIGWWFNRDRYNRKRRSRKFPQKVVRKIIFQSLKNYQQVVLIENNHLFNIHKDYAQEMYSFVDELKKEYMGEGVNHQEVEGSPSLLEKLVFEDFKGATKDILAVPPGEKLHLEGRI